MKKLSQWVFTATARYMLFGIIFGCCFPIIATAADLLIQGLQITVANILWVQLQQPLHWIIDTAPFFLGLFATFAGRRQDLLVQFSAQLEQTVDARTDELSESNQELKIQIAERQKVEQALRESEERFRSLTTSAPIGIFSADTEGTCLYTNQQWQEISGMTFEETLGHGWTNAIVPEEREGILAAWHTCIREGRQFSQEFRFRRPSEEIRWVRSQAVAWSADSGTLLGYVGTVEDITERKQAEEALAERARLAAMGADIGVALAHGSTLQEILQRCAEAYSPAPGCRIRSDLDA